MRTRFGMSPNERNEVKQPTGTEMRVCQDIVRRQERGVTKYGTTVSANPLALKEWLQHAYEECLDQAIYLKRAIEEIENKGEMSTTVDKQAEATVVDQLTTSLAKHLRPLSELQAEATAAAVVLGEEQRRFVCPSCSTWYDYPEAIARMLVCCGVSLHDKTNR